MSQNVIQASFASGELSPTLFGRVDLAKYKIGLARCYNFYVDHRGGISNRPGTKYVNNARSWGNVTLIPFQFNTEQTYMLEFGQGYFRVIKDGAHVVTGPVAPAGIDVVGTEIRITFVGHSLTNNDMVYIEGVEGMTRLNGQTFRVLVVDADHYYLRSQLGYPFDVTQYEPWTTNGTIYRVYSAVSPYLDNEVVDLKYTQSADTMTLVHQNHVPYNLTRTAHDAWTLTPVNFNSTLAAPGIPTVTPSSAGTITYSYVVTTVAVDGSESVASTPGVATGVNMSATAGSYHITWTPVVGAHHYNVYKAQSSVSFTIPTGAQHGYIGTAATAADFIDTNITPDFAVTPPIHENPFPTFNPRAVTYFQQRKVYANTVNSPQQFWMSKPGLFNNFDTTFPSSEGDAITGILASQQVNDIKWMVSMTNGLIMLTGGGAWQISGGQANAPITPRSITAAPQAYTGVSDLPPLVVNFDILYVQALGSTVRDLSYNFFANTYVGNDITVLSSHLFVNHQLASWAYAEEPGKLVWAARDDGKLLSLTYLKEQDVYGWAHHETTDGSFTRVSSVVEGNEHAVYFVVSRTLPDGQTRNFIERLASRLGEPWFVDSGLSYDGVPTLNFYGLDHLEGQKVAILADGSVVPSQIVRSGKVTLDHAASKVTIGLPYTAEFQTLPLDTGEPSVQGKRKKVNAVTVKVDRTRGLSLGRSADTVLPIKERTSEPFGAPIPLQSRDERIVLEGGWDNYGQIFGRQTEPLPATVLAVVPEVHVGDTSK